MKERGGLGGEGEGARTEIASPVDVVGWTKSKMPGGEELGQKTSSWNTRDLGWRVGADATAAACAGSLVAPIIYVIDRGIIENASGVRPLVQSMKSSLTTMVTRPQNFFFSKPFALVFALYSGTYFTANAIDTASSTVKNTRVSSTTHGTLKFASTSAANLSLCLYKDTIFTRMFSTGTARPLPPPTYLLYTLRDCLTIFASFNVPPILAPKLPMHLLPEFAKGMRSESVAQFIAPAAVQFVSTPLHLLGLGYYNNGSAAMSERWRLVRREWAKSCAARICRIVPAFGVGGVVNANVRRNLMGKLE